jgi:protoporphyrinogen oxidase
MDVGIVGAGATGLAAGYELAKRGHQVTVYEAQAVAGGLASGFRVPQWEWALDRFYRHVFAGDQELIALADELGTAVVFGRPKTSVWVNGRPYLYDNPLSVALYPNLPLYVNLRIGMVIAYLKYFVRDGTPLERFTVHEWARRYMGERGYREIWEPMLRGKFKAYHDRVNMAWMWARFAARTPRLGYFEGGYQAFIDRLVEAIRARGGQVHLGTTVSEIAQANGKVALMLPQGTGAAYDRVLTTTSPQRLIEMVLDLPAAYREDLSGLKSTAAVALVLSLRDSILTDGTYWLNLPDGEFPCLSMVEHTNYQDKAHYGGNVIVYLGDYLPADAPQMRMSAQELYDLYRPALAKVRPEFEDGWVRGMWAFHEPYAQPVPEVDHSQRVPAAEQPIMDHLYWACMHHVYPWDRGTNYAVELGQRVARAMDARC